MPESIIAGIPVNFPFEPYEVQRAYMEKVILCLRDSTNGVLESPTGTGKTLSLLCSSLAWLLTKKQEMKANMQKSIPGPGESRNVPEIMEQLEMINRSKGKSNWGVPKIIYASRTHSQLTQAMQELKRTSYSFMRAVVLGSRDQLCIHPEVMREQGNANKIQMCKLRVQTRTCSFHSRVESRKDDPDFRGQPIMDIEDLVKAGQKLKMCPYYASKELVEDADIVFMPYNYLLDPSARKANKIELSNAICILDEAHNIEKICEESASVQIKSSDVAMAIEDTTHIMKAMSSGEMLDSGDEQKDFTIEDLALLKEMLLELEKAIDDIVVENKQEGATFPASYIFDLLAQANISYGSSKSVVALLDKLVQFMAIQAQSNHLRKGGSYQKLSDLLTIVFNNKEETIHKVYRSFKVHVQIEEPKQQYTKGASKDGWLAKGNTTTTSKAAKVINYWCFNPGFGMEQLLNTNVRSVILTSGTLAPLKPLIAELSIPIAQRLENPHIVQSSQVYVKIIGSGPDREQLISNYQNRDNPKYISSLGSTILNVARIVPDGLLVFFPSYPLLNQCVNSWQASGLWADISRYKPIYVEPRSKDDFVTTMESFYQSIKDSKGACFMAVCRGKVSEGLDFADRNGRAVIITGLPFPPLKDPKVILKKKYLEDNRTKENELLTGQAWYALDATRAVNQAIGRVIRHRNDYGAILLCDIRFQQSSQVQQLSKWIRDILGNAPKSSAFGPVVKELRDFFKNADKNMPKPKERSVESLVSDTCEESGAEIVRSKYFADPKEVLAAKTKFQNAHNDAIKIEKTNSIQSWSPNDYASAAGRSRNGKLPSAMDFMSRLDSDVSSIDFNSSSSGSSSLSTGLVKIHKRERSPFSQSTSPSSNSSEVVKKKKYKLVENSFTTKPSLSTTSASSSSSSSATSLNSFAFNKTQLHSVDNKTAPEGRVDFLKVLRSVLSPADFSAFTAALVDYKREDSIDVLLDLLFRLLGQPQLLYMLRGMRRFLKNEHRAQFDKRIAGLTDNPKYISTLGSTILNVARIVPDGLLVFFPSYPLLNQCVNSWQAFGLWADISRYKPIYVEPRSKDDFVTTMESFYQSIKDSKGACFMAVCRGRVSEGLDFVDRNGRAVIITGLPFPPLKDPKVILKKKYLEDNRTKENELLTGQAWYALDATRAVNQAIGRVIRHRNDYGAILLCDIRFQQSSQVQQLSKWIRDILGNAPKSSAFGPVMPKPKERSVESLVSDTCEESGAEIVRSKYFADPKEVLAAKTKFQNAHNDAIKIEKTNSIQSWSPNDYASAAGRSRNGKLPSAMDFMSRLDSDVSSIDFNSSSSGSSSLSTGLVKIHKRERSPFSQSTSPSSNSSEVVKKKKYKLVENSFTTKPSLSTTSASSSSSSSATSLNSFAFNKTQLHSVDNKTAPEGRVDFLKVLRSVLSPADFSAFTAALVDYKREDSIDVLLDLLFRLLGQPQLLYMLRGMRRFLKNEHRAQFDKRIAGLT